MSTAAPKSKPSKKDKKRDPDKPHPGSERLKSIVRRLPPNLPEEIFWGSVSPWVTEEAVSWKAYYQGKLKKRINKENIPSRAYIAFKNEEQLARFGREYDGHVFKDKAGNEYQAVVEFAPYQKVPSDKKKVDARNATIEKDEDYLSFIASLKASESTEPPSLEALLAAAQPPPPPKTTPLLEALKAEKSANKDKEAILRSHAHYKDATILQPPPRDPNSKKKGGASTAPSKPTPAPEPGSSKKGGKKGQGSAPAQGGSKQQPAQSQAPSKTTQGASNAGQSSKPPKHPKPPKQSQQHPSKAPSASTPAAPAPAVPVIATPAKASTAAENQPVAAAATSAAAPAPRRTRPVIGLASRQFEAALSGVAGGAGRARREQASQASKEGGEASPSAPEPSGGGNVVSSAGGKAGASRAKQAKDGSKDGPKETSTVNESSQLKAPAAAQPEGQGSASGYRGGRRGRGRGGGGGRGGAASRGG